MILAIMSYNTVPYFARNRNKDGSRVLGQTRHCILIMVLILKSSVSLKIIASPRTIPMIALSASTMLYRT